MLKGTIEVEAAGSEGVPSDGSIQRSVAFYENPVKVALNYC
jgi:hypothetical protein